MIEFLKDIVVHWTGLSRDALHTQIGLVLLFATCLISRRRIDSWLPVLAVIAAALLSEVFDRQRDIARYGVWDRSGSIHDVVNTVFWPIVLWIMVRTGVVFKR